MSISDFHRVFPHVRLKWQAKKELEPGERKVVEVEGEPYTLGKDKLLQFVIDLRVLKIELGVDLAWALPGVDERDNSNRR